AVGVVIRDEDGMALEPVAVGALLALVHPFLQKRIRHRIVVDRKEQIGRETVRLGDALIEALVSRPPADQQHSLSEASLGQLFLDQPGEAKVKVVFLGTAGAGSAGSFGRVPDIDDDAKRAALANRLTG